MILMASKKPKRIPTGSVFQKTYKTRAGKPQKTATWYIKYYSGGKAIEESTKTEDYDEAVGLLRTKMATAVRYGGHDGLPERVRIGHLLDLLIREYKFAKRKSLSDTEQRV